MSSLDKLLKHEKSMPYSLIGTFLGLVGFIAAIYFSILYEKSPQLDIEITSQFSALDIKESVESLDVIYNNTSLNSQGMSLSVMKLRVINNGNASILRSYYDPKTLAGFEIDNGVIPEKPIVTKSTTSYSKSEVTIEQVDNAKVHLPHLIINPGNYYDLKLIILHESNSKPVLKSFGVIAGFDTIGVTSKLAAAENRNIVERFFDGSFIMNFMRFIILGFIFILTLVFTIETEEKISRKMKERKKTRLIKLFRSCNSQRLTNVPSSFFPYLESQNLRELQYIFHKIKSADQRDITQVLAPYGELAIVQKSEIGRLILNDSALEVLFDFFYYLVEEKVLYIPESTMGHIDNDNTDNIRGQDNEEPSVDPEAA
ncbi:TPA: hypothetical protein VGS89_003443 [Vibrio cholerae]|nr:hypothetical protein [Vibrio cholerae]